MTEIMRHSFLCGKGSQIFPRTLVFFFLETKLDHMLPTHLNLHLTFLCTGLLRLSYHFELDAADHVVREQGFDIQ